MRKQAQQNLEKLMSAVEQADEQTIMMSRQHCHAENLSSIVTANSSGKLTRVFLAWPGHCLHTNLLTHDGDMAVGIHDHRYPLTLQLLCGQVRNTIYAHSSKGQIVHEWRYRSGRMKSAPQCEHIGTAQLIAGKQTMLGQQFMKLKADELHTIDCRGQAAWRVIEGPLTKQVTRLFTQSNTVTTDGLYAPFSGKDAVIEHVQQFVDILGV